ncbi:MAG: arginase family protein, partial [Candidatus Woesearchaeota archaeon]
MRRTKAAIPIIVHAPVTAAWRYKLDRNAFLKGPEKVIPGDIDIRDFTGTDTITHKTYHLFESFYKELFENNYFPITIGSDHSVSIPATTACAKVHGQLHNIRLDRDLDMGIADRCIENCEKDNFDEAGLGFILSNHPEI